MLTDEEDYDDVARVAKLLKVSEYTVYKYARTNTIPAIKIGGQWRFNLAAIRDHLERPVDPWQQSAQSRGRRRAS